MHVETERKFLVKNKLFRELAKTKKQIAQGYLCTDPARTVRVRMSDNQGFLTIKGKSSDDGMSRLEFEIPVPENEALSLLDLCLPGKIEKTRYLVPFGDIIIEVDEFHGENEGLIVAEVELPSSNTAFDIPEWLGREVTGIQKYYNSALSVTPYCQWETVD